MRARFDELVATKLCFPPVSRDVLPRPAVLDRLSRNSCARVTLLSAGAGFGKTTLLTAWRAEPAWRSRPMAWLTLDRGDNDARRFWQYCAAALQPFCSGEYERVKTMLRSPRPWPV